MEIGIMIVEKGNLIRDMETRKWRYSITKNCRIYSGKFNRWAWEKALYIEKENISEMEDRAIETIQIEAQRESL